MTQEFVLPRRRRRVRPYLDLTAMIDTVFNLLIFFAVASTLVGKPNAGMNLRLPKAETAQPIESRVVLALQPGQPIRLNGSPVAADQIGPALTKITAGNLDSQIVVMADESVPYRDLVSALDQVRLASYHRIALAASPKRKSSAKP
ncbi:MAG: biopolymer transporter ExbD [Armatimonadota bacterium]|jgi:biopolymer transport protein ExbD